MHQSNLTILPLPSWVTAPALLPVDIAQAVLCIVSIGQTEGTEFLGCNIAFGIIGKMCLLPMDQLLLPIDSNYRKLKYDFEWHQWCLPTYLHYPKHHRYKCCSTTHWCLWQLLSLSPSNDCFQWMTALDHWRRWWPLLDQMASKSRHWYNHLPWFDGQVHRKCNQPIGGLVVSNLDTIIIGIVPISGFQRLAIYNQLLSFKIRSAKS